MNPLNYGSREACQRLLDAGIVVETEKVWALNEWPITVDHHTMFAEEWRLIDPPLIPYKQQVPAVSMAEAWRELPDSYGPSTTLVLEKHGDQAIAGYFDWDEEDFTKANFRNTNPTDALIDLIIWTRKEGEGWKSQVKTW